MRMEQKTAKQPMKTEIFREGSLSQATYQNAAAFIQTHSKSDPDSVLFRLLADCSAQSGEEIKKKLFFLRHGFAEPLCLSSENAAFLNRALQKLAGGEPVQYILGKTDFFGREFLVKEKVLIPRFDTEILVEAALSLLTPNGCFADLCCGSGCIGITLLAERPDVSGFFADISPAALELTKANAGRFSVTNRAEIEQVDIRLASLPKKFDLILSNPPYIPSEELPLLSEEVRKEPVLALDGGTDGLDFYRAIVCNYKQNLSPGGKFAFECGAGQAKQVAEFLDKNGFSSFRIFSDAGGIERVVTAEKV